MDKQVIKIMDELIVEADQRNIKRYCFGVGEKLYRECKAFDPKGFIMRHQNRDFVCSPVIGDYEIVVLELTGEQKDKIVFTGIGKHYDC